MRFNVQMLTENLAGLRVGPLVLYHIGRNYTDDYAEAILFHMNTYRELYRSARDSDNKVALDYASKRWLAFRNEAIGNGIDVSEHEL